MFAGVGLSYTYTGMVVTDSRLYDRGHMVRRWADGIAMTYKRHVIAEAPINKRANTGHGSPGMLKAGLDTNVERIGPRALVTAVTSRAPHTKYVAGGTNGWIWANTGRAMRLPINAGFGRPPTRYEERKVPGSTLHTFVSGQAPNRFFERAYDATARTHPSLRGLTGSAFRAAPRGTPGAPNPYSSRRR